MNRLLLIAPLSTLIVACGGGDEDPGPLPPASEPIVLTTGLWGKVTATHVGILRPGTYALRGCQDGASGATLQRKLRLGSDGRMELLDAADAVLLSLVPSGTEHQNRSASVQRSGSADTANSYSVSHQRIRYTPGFTYSGALHLHGRGHTLTQVSVQRDGSTNPSPVDEACLVRADGAPVATIEMVFSTAIAREKLASLVTLNGAPISGSPYVYFGARYESVAIAAEGEVTTQTAAGAPLTPWGTQWVEGFGIDKGMWRESWNSSNDASLPSSTPANPSVELALQHPALRIDYASAGLIPQPIALRRNTGSGAAVQLYGGAL